MDTLRTPATLATLIAANIAPLVGILLLGWSPVAILVLYFVDTLLSLGVVLLLVMVHVTGNGRGRPLSGFKDWAQGFWALIVLGAIFALPLSVPLWIVGPQNIAAEFERPGSGLAYGLLLQTAMSALAAARMHRELSARDDDDRVLARRALYLVARWITLFVAMSIGFVELLGPRWSAFVLVAIYGGASVYFELFPERAERFVRGSSARPIEFHGDLDGPDSGSVAQRAEATSPGRIAPPSPPPPKRRGGKSPSRKSR